MWQINVSSYIKQQDFDIYFYNLIIIYLAYVKWYFLWLLRCSADTYPTRWECTAVVSFRCVSLLSWQHAKQLQLQEEKGVRETGYGDMHFDGNVWGNRIDWFLFVVLNYFLMPEWFGAFFVLCEQVYFCPFTTVESTIWNEVLRCICYDLDIAIFTGNAGHCRWSRPTTILWAIQSYKMEMKR